MPGFNKSGRRRWPSNIFSVLQENGSFLEETPDAIISEVKDNQETILYAIEFCSALQAGNQAWQRNGRAFSTGRTGCPYLYIVDFVKYELDSKTREHKALRFPNPVVPYSYINFSRETKNFVAQVYVRSEEFNKRTDQSLYHFNENDFAENELCTYIVKRMANLDTSTEEIEILRKNFNVIIFLAQNSRPSTNFTATQWQRLYTYQQNIIQFSKENSDFNFHKTITPKGHHGKSAQFLQLVDDCSIGLASRDLPFGIIPADSRRKFANGLRCLYPNYDSDIINQISNKNSDLILCIIKGFKPRGDDNRPDRGILPLAVMLSSTDTEIMTYIYGPVLANNLDLLINTPRKLAASNGLWKSILSLNNYVALDVPVLRGRCSDAEVLLNTTELKAYYTSITDNHYKLAKPVFPSVPQEYHEDDVDTGIHFIFAHLLQKNCFEGMCNPPGGDWSGLSVLYHNYETRWLSLPRVSEEVNGKRPDHVLELFDVLDKPLLLSIESKERSADLELDVGSGLINYIRNLMQYIPNVERKFTDFSSWHQATTYVNFNDFEVISAAAYLKNAAQPNSVVFHNTNCDLLFIMNPKDCGWTVEMVPNTQQAKLLKAYVKRMIETSEYKDITII